MIIIIAHTLLHLIAIGTHKIMSGDYDKTVRVFQRRQEGSSIYRRAVGREIADSSYSSLPAYDKRAARPWFAGPTDTRYRLMTKTLIMTATNDSHCSYLRYTWRVRVLPWTYHLLFCYSTIGEDNIQLIHIVFSWHTLLIHGCCVYLTVSLVRMNGIVMAMSDLQLYATSLAKWWKH